MIPAADDTGSTSPVSAPSPVSASLTATGPDILTGRSTTLNTLALAAGPSHGHCGDAGRGGQPASTSSATSSALGASAQWMLSESMAASPAVSAAAGDATPGVS